MDQPPRQARQSDSEPDRVEELFRPVAQFRSPILAGRPPGNAKAGPRPGPHPDLRTIALPPARELVRPLIWAVLAAAPVLALVGWLPAVGAGALAVAIRFVDGRVGRIAFSFGDGFLPFRGYNRLPQGVQEENDVHWNWQPAVNASTGHARG